LGQGSFGRVYLGMDGETQRLMAVKQVLLPNNDKGTFEIAKDLHKEIQFLQKHKHPNIVRYYGAELKDNTLNIFMEYMSGGSLAKNIADFGKIPEKAAIRYTKQILYGLLYLHSKNIAHRDIKGANVLISHANSTVKLADFGCAKEIAQNKTNNMESMRGTANWMAPEVIKQEGGGRFQDIWSLGCTVYEMLVGKPPWHHLNNQFSVLYHIASTDTFPELPPHMSNLSIDFIKKCMK
jgi:serine/threonine protein kinase